MLIKPLLRGILLLALIVLPACQTKSLAASSEIDRADFVRRVDACRALKPQLVSRADTLETINAAVAADAAWQSFCSGDH